MLFRVQKRFKMFSSWGFVFHNLTHTPKKTNTSLPILNITETYYALFIYKTYFLYLLKYVHDLWTMMIILSLLFSQECYVKTILKLYAFSGISR